MKNIIIIFLIFLTSFYLLSLSPAIAVETAPRISDREIVEKLSRIEEGQKALEKRFDLMDKRFDDLRSEMNARFALLTWMFGIFITISSAILGFVVKMQWQMQKRQTHMEASLETQKDEIKFLKELIEKLLPPKGVL